MAKIDAATFPFCAYLDELVDDLRKEIPPALDEHEQQAIHKARVATRRLKAALDLLKPVLSPGGRKRFGKVLKKLRDRLGVERDLDVMLRHLEELAGNSGLSSSVNWITSIVRDEREDRRDKNDRKLGRSSVLRRLSAWDDVRAELAECGEAIPSLLGESIHIQIESFAEGAVAMNNGAHGDDIHKLRLAGKQLRYTLELGQRAGHSLPDDILQAFRKMQDNLGLWHDYIVLTHRLTQASSDEGLAESDMVLQEEVLQLAVETLRRARHQLSDFSRLWHERGPQIAETIRAAFPLTEVRVEKDTPGDAA